MPTNVEKNMNQYLKDFYQRYLQPEDSDDTFRDQEKERHTNQQETWPEGDTSFNRSQW